MHTRQSVQATSLPAGRQLDTHLVSRAHSAPRRCQGGPCPQGAARPASQAGRHSAARARAVQSSYDSYDELDGAGMQQRERLPRSQAAGPGSLPTPSQVEVVPDVAPGRSSTVAAVIGSALAFGLGVWYFLGGEKAQEYYAGYLLEQSLSVDNLFVFILVFEAFKVPRVDQDKVLTWGIGTAAVLRLVMVVLGAELIEAFHPVLLAFAGVLLFSSYRILSAGGDDEEEDIADNGVVRFCRRFIAVSDNYDGSKFFTVEEGVKKATPLLLVLAIIEVSDVVFAVDSIPAVFGVTHDPFIVWSSNMFAIASLRGLYAFVAKALKELRYLEKAVAVVLGWIGVKLVAEFAGVRVETAYSLAIVVLTLGAGIGASLLLKEPQGAAPRGLPDRSRDDRDNTL